MARSTPRPLPPRYHPLRIKEGPIVGIKGEATCTKSRNHPYGCNAKSCRQKYERAIYPERPKSGYCNEK
ncbi:hypothetical protein AG1IA_01282 [Rhizoctonia solani AG-1 IA]|uniref:Uncharacterized protein n=1 Tax=Thanatephorus cucumeris (strain AG1-IA) TaxID=983506 RepID=L8X6L5_THACA|nr:hypothetical protein AG1IA_01282 [Rhizoctonia solani AG-1 IA]